MAKQDEVLSRLRQNVEVLEARIQAACDSARRKRDEVTLVAVTKYVDASTVRLLQDCGLNLFGESRPQAIWEKAPQVPGAEWHLVGHLQRNKVAKTLPLVRLIHSV